MMRYRKNYLCVCEGQQEKMYLDHIARLVKDFPRKVVTFNSYIDRPYRLTKTYEDYDSVAICDFNKVEFERNIALCDKLQSKQKSKLKKRRRNIYHAYSNVNFDLWLILHKEDYNRRVHNNSAYIKDLSRVYGLSSKENSKNEKTIKKILDQITLQDVKAAITRADKIKHLKNKKDATKIASTYVYSNPDFSIHKFLKHVLIESGDF